MLTKAQKAYADEVFARAGKTSPALQQQIKRIRAARSEDELEWLFSSDANVVRPKEEAELLCVVMLTRLDELHSSINAASQKSEQPITKNPVNAESHPTLIDNASIPYNKIAKRVLETILSVGSSICDKMVQEQLASTEIMQQNRLAVSTEFASLYLLKAVEHIRSSLGVVSRDNWQTYFHVVSEDLAKAIFKYGNNTNDIGDVARSIVNPHGFKLPQTQFYFDGNQTLLGVTIEQINRFSERCNSDINRLLPTCVMEACLTIRISRIIGVEEIPSIGNRGKASQIIKSAIFPPLLNVDEDIDSILADRSGESTLSESASDASIRDDRVSVKNQESNSRINIASPEYNQHSITSRPVKVEGPSAFVKRIEKTEQNPNGLFTAVKAIAIIAILFFAVVALLSALFDKKHSGQPIIYYVVSVTIKGHYYEKEATQQDFNSGFVTFEDGTRVPWSAVKSTEIKIYPDELTNAINVINTIPSKQ